ncbi:DUF2971 domain-containing protein (plasmid) [Ensifer adhaerens]|uniref:DUF2971 domain-containing protein n=1 Tax=Ensifer adhaerens TaxID=106592 RepID=UPI0023AA0854|nr:DUF2971 domain-containing protein [Ensifer adhaerens]WDZ81946.1 DUF2971 domain-containing protein [Ensifer adhaerens]
MTLSGRRYADKQTGVVLRFRNIDKHSMWSEARPVEYADASSTIFTQDEIVENVLGIKHIDGSSQFHKLAFTKRTDWENEKEWRIASKGRDTTKEVEDLPFGLPELDGVIFGRSTTDGDKREIREFARRYPKVEFMQATVSRARFDTVLEEC